MPQLLAMPGQLWIYWRRRYQLQRGRGRSIAASQVRPRLQFPLVRGRGLLPSFPSFPSLSSLPSMPQLPSTPACLAAVAALCLIGAGALAIIWHAQRLHALQARQAQLPGGALAQLGGSLQGVVPGLHFRVPQQSGVSFASQPTGSVWIMNGMRAAPPVLVDLCRQQADARHLIPLHIGWRFADVQQAVARNRVRGLPDAFGLKNVIVSDDLRDSVAPRLELRAAPLAGNGAQRPQGPQGPQWQLRLATDTAHQRAADVPLMLSDANPAQVLPLLPGQPQAMKQQAWLQWGRGSAQRALHLSQRPAASCPLGQLQVQWFEPGSASSLARVQVFGWQHGALAPIPLAPGAYEVPDSPAPVLEDQQLFEASLQAGLIHLQADGQIAVAARSGEGLPALARSTAAGTISPADEVALARLHKRLHFALDGSYVRQQIRLFNREQISGVRQGDLAYRHIRLEKLADGNARLRWHPLRKGAALARPTPGEVILHDRNGKPLWQAGQPTEAAIQAGLGPLLLAEQTPGHGVPAVLGRAFAGQQVRAQLTLDLAWQGLLAQIVDCVGLQGGKWQQQGCRMQPGAVSAPAGRRAAMLLLDADTGEILASSQAGQAVAPMTGWQHDGSSFASPGSTFKLLTALALEQAASNGAGASYPAAARQAKLTGLLAGLSLAELNQLGSVAGFRSDGSCYPMPCAGRVPHVRNYRDQLLHGRTADGRFGLAQALSASMNTWFAWQAEALDATLPAGVPDVQPLQSGALDAQRPLLALARQLGFEQTMRLDAGWLPAGFALQAGDLLQADISRFSPVQSRHELRQQAIGLRMQTHVLQMARISAAIASGTMRPPALLKDVQIASANPRTTQPAAAPALTMPLQRIRSGMQGVVQAGTAAQAFAAPAFASFRPYLYGKTGTAPVGDTLNSAWFVGYLDLAAMPAPVRAIWPGSVRRLAFAASVSHTELTGGAHAAPMVAALLAELPALPAVK